MPGFDGLGPNNAGPMTGRGRGYCIKRLDSEEKTSFYGGCASRRGKRGMGKGRGLGRMNKGIKMNNEK